MNNHADHQPRLARQSLLPDFGPESVHTLASAHAVILGLGALGTVAADLLARAGVGTLTIIDRDIVETHNLQRQTLYTDDHAKHAAPKAIAARDTLLAANPTITVNAIPEDLTPANAERLTCLDTPTNNPTVLIDAADNFATRFLLNDLAVKHTTPLVYAGAIATNATVTTILPTPPADRPPGATPWTDPNNPHAGAGPSPCLRCLLGEPPEAAHADSCDTVGVLATVTAAAAAFQATEALKVILGRFDKLRRHILAFDPWNTQFQRFEMSPDARDPDCPCCAHRSFDHLDADAPAPTAILCGRDAVQIPPSNHKPDLAQLAERLNNVANVRTSPAMLLIELNDEPNSIALFQDGRAIVRGTDSTARARALYDRYVGA